MSLAACFCDISLIGRYPLQGPLCMISQKSSARVVSLLAACLDRDIFNLIGSCPLCMVKGRGRHANCSLTGRLADCMPATWPSFAVHLGISRVCAPPALLNDGFCSPHPLGDA